MSSSEEIKIYSQNDNVMPSHKVALKPGHHAQWNGGHRITVKIFLCILIFSTFPLASETYAHTIFTSKEAY